MVTASQSLVSVIIPAYNAVPWIAESIETVLGQGYRNFEVIVVDDGSTDDTAKVVRAYGKRLRYFYQPNGGAGVARNTGIGNSNGDYLCFMDADDLMAPDRLERQVDLLERRKEAAVAFCDYRNFDDKGPFPHSHFESCPLLSRQMEGRTELVVDAPCALLAQENFGCAGTLLMRKSALSLAGGFARGLRVCEDFHFYFRLARRAGVGVTNHIGVLRRLHGNNTTGGTVRMLSDGIVSRTLLRDSESDPVVRLYLNRYIQRCRRELARRCADGGEFLEALQMEWQAFRSDPAWSQAPPTIRGWLRTMALAAGLKKGG